MAPDKPIEGAQPASTPHPTPPVASTATSMGNPSLHSDFSILVAQEVADLQNRAEEARQQGQGQEPHIEALAEAAEDLQDSSRSSTPLSEDWLMTKSQFAQVLFNDVADSYPNDGDLVVQLRLNGSDLEVEHGDRVGLFRMGEIAAHQAILSAWVKAAEKIKDKESEYKVVFKGGELPKSDDFYQFQYLRADNSVLGASIPFELRSPKSEELTAVENESEFLVVQSQQAVLSGHVSDVEKKYSELLDVSQKLNEDLLQKNESFIELEKEYKSMVGERRLLQVMEQDMQGLVKSKKSVEEKLFQVQARCKSLEQELVNARKAQDHSSELAMKASQEKSFFATENSQMTKRLDDLNSMLGAMGKSKELAMAEIKSISEEQQKLSGENKGLKDELKKSEIRRSDLQQCLEALGAKHENLERKHLKVTREKEMEQLHFKAEAEKTEVKVEALTKQLELTQAQLKFEETRNSTLMEKVKALELASSQPVVQTRPGFAKRESGEAQSESLKSDASSMTDYESLYLDGQNRISRLEDTVKNLQLGLEKANVSQSMQASAFKEELEELRIRTVGSTYTPSESSSTRNLDSAVIQEALNQCIGNQQVEAEAQKEEDKEVAEPVEAKAFKPVVQQPTGNNPLYTGTKPKSPINTYRPPSPPGPQIPCSPPTQARAPFVRQIVHNFLPQFPGSILNQKLFQPPQNEKDQPKEGGAGGQAQNGQILPDPLVPQRPEVEVKTGQDETARELNELMAWACEGASEMKAKQAASRQASEERDSAKNSFTLTDDGRPVPLSTEEQIASLEQAQNARAEARAKVKAEAKAIAKEQKAEAIAQAQAKANLECPICNQCFGADEERLLEFHVDSHLIQTLVCPVCSFEYEKSAEEEFQQHVQLHFADESFTFMAPVVEEVGSLEDETNANPIGVTSTVTSSMTTSASTARSRLPAPPMPASRRRFEPPFNTEEEDRQNETPSNRIRNWFLDIDWNPVRKSDNKRGFV